MPINCDYIINGKTYSEQEFKEHLLDNYDKYSEYINGKTNEEQKATTAATEKQQPEKVSSTENQKTNVAENKTVEPPKEPPVVKTETDKNKNDQKPLSVLKRVINNIDDEEVKKGLEEKGINYIPSNQKEAAKIGAGIIKDLGVEEASRQSRDNKFGYGIKSAIDGQVASYYRDEGIKAGTQEEKNQLAEKYLDQLKYIAETAKNFGQYNAQLAHTYEEWGFAQSKKIDEGFQQKREDALNTAGDKNLQSAFSDFTKTPEFYEAVVKRAEEVASANKNIKDTVKKTIDFLDSLKIKKNGTLSMQLIPPPILNGAIEAMKLVVKAGGKIAEAIQAGVDFINKRFDGKWDEDEFKNMVATGFEKIVSNSKEKPLFKSDIERKALADRLKTKLNKLNDVQRSRFISDALDAKNKGTLNYEKFKQLYGDALGLEKMTPELQTHILGLTGKINELTKAQEELQPGNDITPEKIDDFIRKTKEAGIAADELNSYSYHSKPLIPFVTGLMRMATLTPKNILYHITFQALKQPFESIKSVVQTGLDYGVSSLGWKASDGIKENFLYKNRGWFNPSKEMPSGLKQAFKNLTGTNAPSSYYDAAQDYLHPIDSAVRLYKGITKEKSQSIQENIKDFLTVMPHSITSLLERGFQFGFTAFQLPAERAEAENIAAQKGYKGLDKAAFLLNPDEESKQRIIDAGKTSTLKGDNDLLSLINNLTKGAERGIQNMNPIFKKLWGGAKVVGTAAQPFVRIPLNAAIVATRIVVPELAFAESLWHSAKYGFDHSDVNRKNAINAAAWGITGMAVHALVFSLAKNGLIVSTPTGNNPDDREKMFETARIRQTYAAAGIPEKSINWSAMLRYYSGRDYTPQPNDIFVPLHSFGTIGTVMEVAGSRYDEETPEQQQQHATYFSNLMQDSKNSMIDGFEGGVYSGTSNLAAALVTGQGNNALMSMTNVFGNVVQPSVLANLVKTKEGDRPDYTNANGFDKVLDNARFRFGFGSSYPKQVDIYGKQIGSAPEGANPLMYYNFIPTQTATSELERLQPAIQFMKSRDIKLTSDYQGRKKYEMDEEGNKTKVTLTPQQYTDLKTAVGQSRLNALRGIDFSGMTDAEKQDAIISALREGEANGKSIFETAYPNLTPSSKGYIKSK